MAQQISLRDVVMKLGLTVGEDKVMNPIWDWLIVIEDPISDPRDSFRCDNVVLGNETIIFHMGDQIGV